MKNKKTFYTELSYLLGILILALGTAFMERVNFGVSMVVAPAYILHLKISQILPFFSFGMAEYTLQAVLLILIAILLRKFKLTFLFSFVTAVFYGFVLDGMMALIGLLPMGTLFGRLLFYVVGLLACSVGVALLFHTYIAPEAYELFVKELSAKYHKDIHKFKTVYDCCSCVIAILLSFIFFGFLHFEGVKLGTIFCALVNGSVIGVCSKMLERNFEFKDKFELRRYF